MCLHGPTGQFPGLHGETLWVLEIWTLGTGKYGTILTLVFSVKGIKGLPYAFGTLQIKNRTCLVHLYF